MHACVHANFCAVGFYGMFLDLHLLAFTSSTFNPIQDLTQTRVCGYQGGGKQEQLTADCSMSCTVPALSGDSVQIIAQCHVVCQH